MNKDTYIVDTYELFIKFCSEISTYAFNAQNIYNNVLIDKIIFTESMRNFIVDHAFLNIYINWEHYIEGIFLGFMLGCKGLKGGIPTKYVAPTTIDHAYKIVSGINTYPDWSDMSKVLTLAQNFFENSGPFSLLMTIKSNLSAIKKVRNNIAHMSNKSQIEFENLVRSLVGFLPENINTSSFLIEYNVKNVNPNTTYFQYYIDALQSIAKALIDI
jgi:hypothetical protein